MVGKEEVRDQLLSFYIEDSVKKLQENVETKIENITTSLEAKIDGVKAAALDNIKQIEEYINRDVPLVVNLGSVEVPDKKLVHKAFSQIVKILSSAKRKEKNIMLVGAAGGGKTHLVGSVAEALKLQFYPMSVGLQTTKSDLLGFINAHGNYVTTPIREAYEKGGVLLLDEFDATHAGVVTILNSLLANGHCSFPDKIVEKHKDFICLCACNTYGKGGNTDYVGRNRLDAATLDRFIIVNVDYDTNLEKALTNNDSWIGIINKIRSNAEKQGIKTIVSPRASIDGADLLEAGFDISEVLEMVIFKGVNKDIQTKLLESVDLSLCCDSSSDIKKARKAAKKNVYINFDEERYNVSTTFPEVKFYVGEFNIKISEGYSPYLTEKTLYLNQSLRKFTRDSDLSDIEAFIGELKYNNSNYNGDFNLAVTVIFRGEETKIVLEGKK